MFVFFVFRAQADVSFSATDNAQLYRKQRQTITEKCAIVHEGKLEELKQLDCPWTSFRDVMAMP